MDEQMDKTYQSTTVANRWIDDDGTKNAFNDEVWMVVFSEGEKMKGG